VITRVLQGTDRGDLCYDSWSLSHLGYLYPGTTPVVIKLDISLHGIPVVIPTNDREMPGSTPGRYDLQIKITTVMVKNSGPAWHSAVRLCDVHQKQRWSYVFIDSQTHVPSQGTEFVMNFALRYRGNRTHTGANPSLIRSQTLTTRPTVYIQLVPNAYITCDGNIRYQSYIHGWPSG